MLHTAAPTPLPHPPWQDTTPAVRAQRWLAHWARDQHDVRAAQRLRHQVFVVEGAARVPELLPGHEIDAFDPYCDHLLVRGDLDGEVVGTYRVLTPSRARAAGSLYSDGAFDLSPLQPLLTTTAELGRACVHADHRDGGVILALWRALAEFMQARGLTHMIGCASLPMHDGGHRAASLWRGLWPLYAGPPALRVQPRHALPLSALDDRLEVEPPPLLKGYLRMGARLLGPPSFDPDFRTADLPVLLALQDMPARYRRRYIDEGFATAARSPARPPSHERHETVIVA